jgi:outer membrane murein-binding lipoprotein Lpp
MAGDLVSWGFRQDVATVNSIVERLKQGTDHLANAIAAAQAAVQKQKNRWSMCAP